MSINNIQDYYYILGLAKSAPKDEIKRAYRKLSLKFHPDQNNGDKFFEERFRDINEAYETLIDDTKRKWFDDKLSAANNAHTVEGNYCSTDSPQSQQSKKQQEYRHANTPPPEPSFSTAQQKLKSNKVLYTVVAILFFTAPFIIKMVIDTLNKNDTSKNYKETVQYQNNDSAHYQTLQNSSYDTAASMTKNIPARSSNVPAPGASGASLTLKDTHSSTTLSQNDNSRAADFKDEDGLTATDALKYFLQALNNNNCNAAWSMAYNETWQNYGQDWFCSSQAFGGVRRILIRNMYPVIQNYAEVEMYVDYYAEDIYNGNKCFKQNITLREIAFTDKTRWKITKMRNVEDPVACDGN